jgi:hypothetical protein
MWAEESRMPLPVDDVVQVSSPDDELGGAAAQLINYGGCF